MVKNNLYLGLLVGCFLVAILAFSRYSAEANVSSINIDRARMAVQGYDVVSYQDGGVPELGHPDFTIEHGGAFYLFANAQNMKAFSERPAAFLPEFGGFCAYGVRMGQKLPIDPKEYTVYDKRLYLFLDHATRASWLDDMKANIEIARTIWPELR